MKMILPQLSVNTNWFLLSIASIIVGLILGCASTLAIIIVMSWRTSTNDVCLLKRSEIIVCIVLQVVYMACFIVAAIALYQSTVYNTTGAGSSKDQGDNDDDVDGMMLLL